MFRKFLKIAGATALLSMPAVTAHAALVEDFEDGLDPAWEFVSEPSFGVIHNGISSADAINGDFGLGGGNTWFYLDNAGAELNQGDRLSALIRTADDGSTGRFYLGFDADNGGASSFVAASNTSDIRFQNNDGYGFEELNHQNFTFAIGHTYLMTIDFLEDGVVGSIFDETGTTLFGSLEAVGLDLSDLNGVALRSLGGFSIDDVTISAVPVPPAMALGLTGLIGIILLGRRRTV